MLVSVILNAAIVVCVVWSVITELKKVEAWGVLFRFFTTLSNVLLALSSAVLLVCSLWGELPVWAVMLKYAGTAAVTVTMLTVLLFLGPVSHQWKLLLTGPQLLLHLICPILALVSFIFFENTALPLWTVILGVLPVLLYGAVYCRMVVYAPEERRWDDFYGFNSTGKWVPSMVLMLIAAAVIAFAVFFAHAAFAA